VEKVRLRDARRRAYHFPPFSFSREARTGERSMKIRMDFGECPRCHVRGILVHIAGIKALCHGCLSTATKFLQAIDEIGREIANG
jgi:hypothetical protein